MQDPKFEGLVVAGMIEPSYEPSNSTMQSHFVPTFLRAYMGLFRLTVHNI